MKIKSIETIIKPNGDTRHIVTYTSDKVSCRQFIKNVLNSKEFDFCNNSTDIKRFDRYGGAIAYIYK